jgi:hypothetical protein
MSTTPLAPADEFISAFGEPLANTLDLRTWQPVENLGNLYGELEAEVAAACEQSVPVRQAIRDKIFPRLAERTQGAPGAGVYQVTLDDLEAAHRGLLFRGAVEAGNGIAVTHESLGLSVTQIGICLVSYQADLGSWVHRLYRRDLRAAPADPEDLAIALIEGQQGFVSDDPLRMDRLTDIARRGIMAYAERAALVERSAATWKMGHGNPLAHELLTGSGSMDLLRAGLALLQRLVIEHPRFVFVPSGMNERELLAIGDALQPLEYLIFETMIDRMRRITRSGHFSTEGIQRLGAFINEIGPQVVIGCYRASAAGPARVFYAHADHAHEAALIALADSTLHEHRAFPALLDLADLLCRNAFGAGDFTATLRDTYAIAGQPYAFHEEFGRRG